MKRLLLWLGLILPMPVVFASAQTNNAKVTIHAQSISRMVDYVLTNGSPSLAKIYITQLMHLGDQDVPVIQKGWHTHDGMNHLVAVSKNNHADVMIFLYNDQGRGVGWLTSTSGELRCAVKFNHPQHVAEIIPNDKVAASFETERAYLFYQMVAPKKKR
ncbi:MAG TPA: hypothetical protein VGO57_06465 [Verrucomicrobiae bacterium]|jgi:hypothetical protein